MTIEDYIDSVNRRYKLGNATEHTFRGDLQGLIETLATDIRATNEPKRQACGAPDYILTKGEIPIGYIEAKDIGDKDLDGGKKTGNKEQFDRYKASLNNLMFTDYLDFHLYLDGDFKSKISIGEVKNGAVIGNPQNYPAFTNLIKDFCIRSGQNIKSPKKLAELMAGKARLLSDVIEKSLTSDETNKEDSTLKEQMSAFKQILIHDITAKGFADVYAQTIAYGLFAARLHDPTLPTFSRQEAAELIPKSNPFLRKLFGYIAGPDIDDRIKWIVDGLVEIFLSCNVEEILAGYGKSTKTEDPIIHFYETFLSEYDPKLRKARGVWYTPAPVVNFIVRAVDDILKTEFDLPQGLADNSKIKIKVDVQGKKVEQEVHKVQILDPATGTGTFLAEVIKQVHRKFEGQQGIWSNYVEDHLLPRLNGFEILMASYAMAHLQLDLLLTSTGYSATGKQRFRVYLANSLEESHPDTGTLFANWLSEEANEANHIKRDTPVMCVIGNPPYSVSSSNRNPWIEQLMLEYKRDLNERNIQPLSDDYIKFTRFGQHLIGQRNEGILAFISNNSFLDGIIHRQMRKSLLETFDKVFVLDLHGSIRRNEQSENGGKDENVFDIQQGVSINIFVKSASSNVDSLGQIFHLDLFGSRAEKYEFLNRSAMKTIEWDLLQLNAPNYFFTKKDFDSSGQYETGFKLDELFPLNASGIKTERDNVTIQLDENKLQTVEDDFINLDIETIRNRHTPKPDGRDWRVITAKEDLIRNQKLHCEILYRPFDIRRTIYTGKTKGFMSYPRHEVMNHLLNQNLALLSCRQQSSFDFQHVLVSKWIVDMCTVSLQTKETTYCFPLYCYPDRLNQNGPSLGGERWPNLNQETVKNIAKNLRIPFESEKSASDQKFSPIDILDYVYAVLHSPIYRKKYKEFLKIDFPRVVYPKDAKIFWELVRLGGELRKIHLLESPIVEKYITQYPIDGTSEVVKPQFVAGKVYINELQFFDNVPEVAWNFFIGGYQPAQKWLKDRKSRTLNYEDILHYQKIIAALAETDRLMKEIDKIDFM